MSSPVPKSSSFCITSHSPGKVNGACHLYLSVDDMAALTEAAFQPETKTLC